MARASSGTLSSRNRSSAGMPACEALRQRPDRSTSRLFSCGAKIGERLERRGELHGGRSQLVDERLGGDRESLDAVDRLPLRDQEAREGPDRGRERVGLGGGGRERGVGVVDELLERRRRAGDRGEHLAAVAQQRAGRGAVAVQHGEHRVDVGGERVQLGQGGVQVLPAPGQRDPLLLHPGLEGLAGGRVEGREDLVELDGRRDLAVGQRGPVGQLRARCASPARARRRSLPAASSGAGSRGCRPGGVRTADRSRSPPGSAPVRRSRLDAQSPCRRSRRRSGRPPGCPGSPPGRTRR